MNRTLLFILITSLTFGILRLEKSFESHKLKSAPVKKEKKEFPFDPQCVECPV